MKYTSLLAWGFSTVLAFGIAAPSFAKPDGPKGPGAKPTAISITVREISPEVESRAFQNWSGRRMRDYDRIDPETGERLSDLIQVVVDVNRDSLMVSDQQGLRRGIFVNDRTQIVQSLTDGRREPNSLSRQRRPDLTTVLHPGDLIVAQGYLRVNGGIVATMIRVIDRGPYYDNSPVRDYRGRTWGEVRDVDTRRNQFDIVGEMGKRTVDLDRNAKIILDGREVSLGYLRNGNRVIVYYRENTTRLLTATRIVVLTKHEPYPDSDRPYWADPDYRDHGRDNDARILNGRVEATVSGLLFNRLILDTDRGRDTLVYVPKGMDAVDRDGDRVDFSKLRDGQRLRVFYLEVNDTLFAERILID